LWEPPPFRQAEATPPKAAVRPRISLDRSGEFNQRANSSQANPSKTKQNSLDFLGFIRPNRDLSMGYERKNKKIDSRLKLCAKRLKRYFHPFLLSLRTGKVAGSSGDWERHSSKF
jgi:hypothetical protein